MLQTGAAAVAMGIQSFEAAGLEEPFHQVAHEE